MPALQYYIPVIESGPLMDIQARPDVQFAWQKWWDGSYQKDKSNFINDAVGFRPDFFRINNELDLLLYGKVQSSLHVFAGKDKYIFEQSYVDEFNGYDYMGDDTIIHLAVKLKMIQDTLEKLGKTIIFTYGPAKPYLFPEKLPWVFRTPNSKTNYRSFVRLGDSLHLNQIDFCKWLPERLKDNKNSIITRRGVHWTPYAALLAADSLIKYIERKRNVRMPEVRISRTYASDTENEMEENMYYRANLVFPVKKEKELKAIYSFVADSGAQKLKTMYLGDSFIAYWVRDSVMANINSYWEYWFYFEKLWTSKSFGNTDQPFYVVQTSWINSILNADCVVIMWTSFNLFRMKFSYFYVDQLYDYFYPDRPVPYHN